MKKIRSIYLIWLFLFTFSLITVDHSYPSDRDTIFQASILNSLSGGVYDGDIAFGQLRQHGDFGIGTVNALDGEMIGLDGKFYQIKSDGMAYYISNSEMTPFAMVTFFDIDTIVPLKDISSYGQLQQYLDSFLPTKNIFYAIKIEGVFDYIQARSVPKQSKPYPKLNTALENQIVFDFHNIEGTLVGFRCPSYIGGLNSPGYHFHFISKDKRRGGHLLQCKVKDAKAQIDYTKNFLISLPEDEEFYRVEVTDKPSLERDIDISEDEDEDF